MAWVERSGVAPLAAAAWLRGLEDPGGRAVFEAWAQSNDPRMRREAWLGIASLADPPGLAFERLARMTGDRVPARSALLSEALSADLVDARTRRRLWSLPGLTDGERLQLAVADRAAGVNTVDPAALVRILESEHRTRAALAAVLLHDAGDRRGTDALSGMATAPQRIGFSAGDVRAALNLIARLRLTSGGGLALSLASDARDPELRRRALRAALSSGVPGADRAFASAWQRAERDAAERFRLALLALAEWPTVPTSIADLLAGQPDLTHAQIGLTLRRLGEPRTATPDQALALDALVRLRHPPIEEALRRAVQHPLASAEATDVLAEAFWRDGRRAEEGGFPFERARAWSAWMRREPAAAEQVRSWTKGQTLRLDEAHWQAFDTLTMREGAAWVPLIREADVAVGSIAEAGRWKALLRLAPTALDAADRRLLKAGSERPGTPASLTVLVAWRAAQTGGALPEPSTASGDR